MFEPIVPERKLNPPESFGGNEFDSEEWIADKSIELRGDREKIADALEWYGAEHGNEDLHSAVANWMSVHQVEGSAFFQKQDRAQLALEGSIETILNAYTEEVLFPQHLKSIENGDFHG